jgi:hypothetical protein
VKAKINGGNLFFEKVPQQNRKTIAMTNKTNIDILVA